VAPAVASSLWTLADSLDELAPRPPAALVSEAARDAVAEVLGELHASVSRSIYLECRLSPGDARTDVIVRIDRETRAELACTHRRGWHDVRALACEWIADPALSAAVDGMWLEFDVTGAPTRRIVASPGVFVDISARARRVVPDAGCRLLDRVSRALRRTPLRAATRTALECCVRALPRGASVLYLGSFPGRVGGSLRVCICGVRGEDVAAYLTRIRWPGDRAELMSLLTMARGALPHRQYAASVVHLDLGDGIEPTLACEIGLARDAQRRGHIAEQPLLAALVERGLCDSAKRRALNEWPSVHSMTLAHELWPSTVTRRVNHVKLCVRPGHAMVAKAYLSASYRFDGIARTRASIQ
jgi:hypothetical protein